MELWIFIPPRFFMACTQFNLHFYEDGAVYLRGLVRVEFKDKLLREMKGGFPMFNPLNPELSPICCLLALLGAHHFIHVSRIRVKLLTLRRLMPYIYGAPILDVSRSHTTTQHSR